MSGFMTRIANAARALAGRPKSGREVPPSDRGFEVADLFTGDLTPKRLAAVLKNAVYGGWEEQFALFDRLVEMDGHLRSVYGTRKMAIGGLDWELVPATEVGKHPKLDESLAETVRDHVAESLADLEGFDDALAALPDAIGRGIKVIEIEYRNQVPVACHVVEDCQLRGDGNNPKRIRIALEDNWNGIAVDEYPAGKFIVHAPDPIGGLPIRGGLLRVAVLPVCAKRFSIQSWIIFNEIFGQPMTIAKYGAEGDEKVRSDLTKLLRTLGQNRGGVFPANADVQLVEAAAKGQLPQERFASYSDADNSKLFLGQTLTTQIGETGGAMAAATVHDEVRRDLLEKDVADEAKTIRSQLIIPLVRMKFGDEAVRHAPYFRRVIEDATDLLAQAELFDRAINRLGAKVPKRVVSDELGIPLIDAEKPDEALPGAVGGDPFQNDLSFNSQRHATASVAHRALTTIVKRRRSPAARLSSWIFAAVLASTAHTANVVASVQSFIEKRRTLEEAANDLPAVLAELPIDEMQTLQEHFLLASKMAGRADGRSKIVRSRRVNSARLVAHEAIDFGRIPFVQAIESLRDRIGLTPDEFLELEAEARSRAWRVAGVHDMSVLATIHQALVKSIAEGETPRGFRNRLPAMVNAAGWGGENPWHADLVHFQNFTMAHEAGRYAEYREFGAAGWRFVSNGDACPLCAPLVNKVFPIEQRKHFPPVHFWCDCESEVVFEGEVENFDDEAAVKHPALDEEHKRPSAFKWDPAAYANLEPVKLGGFPDALRPAFKSFAEGRGWETEE